MPKNIGVIDRALRVVVGLILIALALLGIFTPWGWVGVVPLVTAVFGFCPAYTLLGVKTCSVE